MSQKSPTGARTSVLQRSNSIKKNQDVVKVPPKLSEPEVSKLNPEISKGLTDQEVEIEHLK